MFSYEFCKISKNIFFAENVWASSSKYKEIFYAIDLKSKIFAGIYFRKVSGFGYNRTENCYRGTAPCRVILRVVAFKNTPVNKNMFKIEDTRVTSVKVIWVSFDCLIKYYLKSVTKTALNKASSL